ncbi:hypothetical protein M8C21_024891 [Ambrosia artemisiifolia]|uniref:Uncharacterized protein n=1 Tax=Ambrosia artemisiifolia TaxID=4212 RepID=A0AAD5CMG4_AMBAR|nr:hypothetical protein M8C21_024891 [Ambrosia artemisiifolia]
MIRILYLRRHAGWNCIVIMLILIWVQCFENRDISGTSDIQMHVTGNSQPKNQGNMAQEHHTPTHKILFSKRTIMVLTNLRPESEFICRHEVIEIKKRYQAFEETATAMDMLVNYTVILKKLEVFNAPAPALKFDRLRIGILGLKLQVPPVQLCASGHRRTTRSQALAPLNCRWYCIQFMYKPQHLVRLLPIVVDGNCLKFNTPAAALEIDRLRIRILGLKLQVPPVQLCASGH